MNRFRIEKVVRELLSGRLGTDSGNRIRKEQRRQKHQRERPMPVDLTDKEEQEHRREQRDCGSHHSPITNIENRIGLVFHQARHQQRHGIGVKVVDVEREGDKRSERKNHRRPPVSRSQHGETYDEPRKTEPENHGIHAVGDVDEICRERVPEFSRRGESLPCAEKIFLRVIPCGPAPESEHERVVEVDHVVKHPQHRSHRRGACKKNC